MELKLHEVIKREIKNRGLSLNELAKDTSIPLSSLHNWLMKRPPSGKNFGHLKTLSDYFGLSLTSLIFNVADSDPKTKILFSSEFVDAGRRYRLLIEKVET